MTYNVFGGTLNLAQFSSCVCFHTFRFQIPFPQVSCGVRESVANAEMEFDVLP